MVESIHIIYIETLKIVSGGLKNEFGLHANLQNHDQKLGNYFMKMVPTARSQWADSEDIFIFCIASPELELLKFPLPWTGRSGK